MATATATRTALRVKNHILFDTDEGEMAIHVANAPQELLDAAAAALPEPLRQYLDLCEKYKSVEYAISSHQQQFPNDWRYVPLYEDWEGDPSTEEVPVGAKAKRLQQERSHYSYSITRMREQDPTLPRQAAAMEENYWNVWWPRIQKALDRKFRAERRIAAAEHRRQAEQEPMAYIFSEGAWNYGHPIKGAQVKVVIRDRGAWLGTLTGQHKKGLVEVVWNQDGWQRKELIGKGWLAPV